jgi:molybdate transport system ATP-binding protein
VLNVDIRKTQGFFRVNASFVTRETGVTALFGPSGAGKTSVINMIAGLVEPDEGAIIVNGRAVFDSARGLNLPPEARRFGYVFQDGRLFPHMSVKQNLMYGMRLVARDRRYADFDQIVGLLGIGHLLDRRPAKLSGGEKQRVAIGRSLLTSPELLLMDEPLASLDQARKLEVLPFIDALTTELSVPIVYVSHAVDEILSIADSVVVLEDGTVVTRGRIQDIAAYLEPGRNGESYSMQHRFRQSL